MTHAGGTQTPSHSLGRRQGRVVVNVLVSVVLLKLLLLFVLEKYELHAKCKCVLHWYTVHAPHVPKRAFFYAHLKCFFYTDAPVVRIAFAILS